MVRSDQLWARTFVRRGLVAAIMVLALAIYGLVSAGTQSLVLKPTAAGDTGAASKLAVSEAVSSTNGSLNVATQGPNHSLFFYWNVAGKWYGPLGIGGAGTTFSAPTIVAETQAPDAGNFDIVAEGPNHSLNLWWDVAGTWYGPLGIGPFGSTYSTPSIGVETLSPYNIDVSAQGPNNTLNTFWDTAANAQWHGPAQIDGASSTFSAPSLVTSSSGSNNEVVISYVGRNNALRDAFYDQANAYWTHSTVANDGSAFSAPSQMDFYSVYQGPNNSLRQDVGSSFPYTLKQLAGGGNVFSSPAQDQGEDDIAFQGPSNSLYFVFQQGGGWGQLQVGNPGTTFSAPALTTDASGNLDFIAVGPNNSLLAWWQIAGKYYGPLQIAGPGSAFVSPT